MSKQTAAQLMEEMNAVVNEAAEAEQKTLEKGKNIFESYLHAIFEETPALDIVIIRGYTPGFNDGDECVHSTNLIVHNDDFSDYGIDDDVDEDGDEILEVEKRNKDLTKTVANQIKKDLRQVEDALEGVYGTNWQLDVTRKEDGSINVAESDYDCGH